MLMPDFRSEERTFQLVTQLAGRSGRDGPGRVIVQTFTPDARPVALAARHALEEFLAGELERREALGYPPFRHLVRLLVSGPDAGGPDGAAVRAARGSRGECRRRRPARSGAAAAAPRPRIGRSWS